MYKGLEHLQILVSAGVQEPKPHRYQVMTVLVLQRDRQSTIYTLTPGRLSQSFFNVFRDQGLLSEYGVVTSGAKRSSRSTARPGPQVPASTQATSGRERFLLLFYLKEILML